MKERDDGTLSLQQASILSQPTFLFKYVYRVWDVNAADFVGFEIYSWSPPPLPFSLLVEVLGKRDFSVSVQGERFEC